MENAIQPKAMEVIRLWRSYQWWCKFHLQSVYLVITYQIQLILYVYSELFIYSQDIPYFKIKTVINHDLLELNAWSSKWLMSFNPEKTEILFFSKTGNIDNMEFSFNGISIGELSSSKMQNGMNI